LKQAVVEWLIETNQVQYHIFSWYLTYGLIYEIATSSLWSPFFQEDDEHMRMHDPWYKAAISEADLKRDHAYIQGTDEGS
jgi:hypothetical protein